MGIEWDPDVHYLLTVGDSEVELDVSAVKEIEKVFRQVNTPGSGIDFRFIAVDSHTGLRTWLFLPAGVPLVIREAP